MSLLARRPRIGCIVVSVIAAPILAGFASFAFGIYDPPDEIPAAIAQRAFEREAGESAHLGMRIESDRTEDLGPDDIERTETIQLAAGECVGITATAWGYHTVRAVAIEQGTQDLVRGEQEFAVANAAQWCADTAREYVVKVEIRSSDSTLGRPEYSEGHLRWQIARGPVEGMYASLTRGVPTPLGARSVSRETLLSLADRHVTGTALGPLIEIRARRARLIPESAEVYGELHDRANNGRGDPITPRWDPLPLEAPAAWRPLGSGPAFISTLTNGRQTASDGEHPAIVFTENDGYRALLVVKPSELGVSCATVQLVRTVWGYETAAGRLDEHRVQRNRNVMSDRICRGTSSIVTYVAPASDDATYLLRFFTD